MKNKSLKCKFCKKVYMQPCHGKKAECPNNIYTSRKIDPYKLSYAQFMKIKKLGKIPTLAKLKEWISENEKTRAKVTVKAKGKKRARLGKVKQPKKRARL